MLKQPLQLPLSTERYLLKEICGFITEPPSDNVIDVIDDMIKEAYSIADNKNQIFRTRHIVYVDTYYRIGMYKSALNSVCNIPWYMTNGALTTPAEKRKIIRTINKHIPEAI